LREAELESKGKSGLYVDERVGLEGVLSFSNVESPALLLIVDRKTGIQA
jgi:hypothetical protein